MGALGVFILILIFSFIGPYFIPYSYEDQYRSAQKLGPMQYSETEQLVQNLMKEGADGFYATSLKSGSLTAIKKGDWYFTAGGETYAFSLDKALSGPPWCLTRMPRPRCMWGMTGITMKRPAPSRR